MTQRPPQDLSDLPRMVPDREDIASRRGYSDHGTQGGGPGSQRKPPRVWPLYLFVFLLAGALGYLGYEFWLAREELRTTASNLTDARDRVANLEGQLSETDESLSLNATAIQANFNNILAEIRQLWEVADRRNLDWIRANQDALDTLAGTPDQLESIGDTLASLQTSVTELESAQSQQADSLGDLSTQVGTLEARSEEQNNRFTELRTEVERQGSGLDVVTNRADSAIQASTENSQQLNTVDGNLVSLRAQLENEAATRSDLASSVSSLRAQLDELEAAQKRLTSEVGQDQGSASAEAFTALQQRVTNIDNARADIIQRLANLQEEIEALRQSRRDSSAPSPQEVEIIDNG